MELKERIVEATKTIHSTLEAIKGKSYPVLEDGFVRFIDYMGTDASVVQMARVSYGEGTKKVHGDRGLIRYLLRHRHTSPLEACEIKFHIRCPIDVARQWMRHRTWSYSEVSTRYSEAIDSCHIPLQNGFRYQTKSNRQGSSGVLNTQDGDYLRDKRILAAKHSRQHYKEQLDMGVAREQAREILPLSTYTEFYAKVDLHNLLHFLGLRLDSHAQEEIRLYAERIADVVKIWVPLVWEAFRDYHLEALTLTRLDIEVLRALLSGEEEAEDVARPFGWFETKSNRERKEFLDKLEKLGMPVPW